MFSLSKTFIRSLIREYNAFWLLLSLGFFFLFYAQHHRNCSMKPVCHEQQSSNELPPNLSGKNDTTVRRRCVMHTSGRDGTSAIQLNCRRLTKAGVVAILVQSEGQWFRVGTLWCRRTGKLSNCWPCGVAVVLAPVRHDYTLSLACWCSAQNSPARRGLLPSDLSTVKVRWLHGFLLQWRR